MMMAMSDVGRLTWFNHEMAKKLEENSYKTDWREDTLPVLLDGLREEVAELEEAIAGSFSPPDIIQECADVANRAMMIADKASLDA